MVKSRTVLLMTAVMASTLACLLATTAASASTLKFQTEKGWSFEGKQSTIKLSPTFQVACEKVFFAGHSPSEGFSTTIVTEPKYSECHFEVKKEGKTESPAAKIAAEGCKYEFLNPEESGKNVYSAATKITGCTGGKEGGIRITGETEKGKTCTITVPEQEFPTGATAKTTKEAAPLGGEGSIDFSKASVTDKGCSETLKIDIPDSRITILLMILIIVIWF